MFNNGRKIVLIIVVVIASLATTLSFAFSRKNVADNVPEEIEQKVRSYIAISNGWGRKSKLKSMLTDEYYKKIVAENDRYRLNLYSIENISVYENTGDIINVSVTYEGRRRMIAYMSFEKLDNGEFVLSNVEYDI